jgi:hypothetical protein
MGALLYPVLAHTGRLTKVTFLVQCDLEAERAQSTTCEKDYDRLLKTCP